MRSLWLLLVLLTLAVPSRAGKAPRFAYLARISPVPRDGYYRIRVPPALLGRLRSDHGDLRLYGPHPSEEEVPYLLPDPDSLSLWTDVAPVRLTQRDSADCTVLTLRLRGPRLVERLVFDVVAPARFYRPVEVWQPNEAPARSRRGRRHWQPWAITTTAVLQSDTSTGRTVDIYPSWVRDSVLRVVIRNGSDAPLRVAGIKARARHRVLTAYLEAHRVYVLRGGHPTIEAPNYDLGHFRRDIPARPPIALVGDVRRLRFTPAPPTERWVLWAALAGVGLVLAAIAARLVEEMRTGKPDS